MAGVCAYCMACVCRQGAEEHTRLLCVALESFGGREIVVRVREEVLQQYPSLLGEREGVEGGEGGGGGGGGGGERGGERGSERKGGVGREGRDINRGGGGWDEQRREEIGVQEDKGRRGSREKGSHGKREEDQEEEITEAVLSLCGCLLKAVKTESKVGVREELVEGVVGCVLLLLQTQPVADLAAQSFLDSLVEVGTGCGLEPTYIPSGGRNWVWAGTIPSGGRNWVWAGTNLHT